MIAKVRESTPQEASNAVTEARKAWPQWASIPMPARGDIVRQIGDELRRNLEPLGRLVSLEMGNLSLTNVTILFAITSYDITAIYRNVYSISVQLMQNVSYHRKNITGGHRRGPGIH